MDRQIDRWMDGWIDRQTDSQSVRYMETDRQIDTDKTDRQIHRDRQTDPDIERIWRKRDTCNTSWTLRRERGEREERERREGHYTCNTSWTLPGLRPDGPLSLILR